MTDSGNRIATRADTRQILITDETVNHIPVRMYNNFELTSDSSLSSNRAPVSIDMSLVFVVRYHFEKS